MKTKLPEGWREVEFLDSLENEASNNKLKIQGNDFLETGKYPIIDQGKIFIAGYTNDKSKVYSEKLPAVIFGDHTRIFKFVDFPFALGADGVKILVPKKEIDVKYYFFYLRNLPILSAGYSRHYKFLKEKYSKNIAINSVITFLCFPTTFFAVAYYSEGLFLLLTVLVFFFLNQKKILQAALAIIFASLTRSIGMALILSLVYNYFSSISFTIKNVSKKVLYLLPSTLGAALYITYLFYKLNNPFGFISVQTLWLRNINDPISTIIGNVWIIFTNPNAPFDQYTDLLITLIFLSLLIFGVRKISSSLWIFSMLVILIPASTGTLTSMPRYVLASLGVFVILGQLLEEKPYLKVPIWMASLFLQAILATKFVNGYWVA